MVDWFFCCSEASSAPPAPPSQGLRLLFYKHIFYNVTVKGKDRRFIGGRDGGGRGGSCPHLQTRAANCIKCPHFADLVE